MRQKKNERGVVLVLVLGLVALVAAWAIRSADADLLAIDRAERQKVVLLGKMGVESGIELAKAMLREDGRHSEIDHLNEAWAVDMPAFQVDEGSIRVSIRDMGRYYNLNNLVRDGRLVQTELVTVRRIFRQAEVPEELTGRLADWMDADSVAYGSGHSEGSDYFDSPYRVKNAPLDRLEELLLIPGFDYEIFKRLALLVRAYPAGERMPVNINTASARVLAAVAGVGEAEAETIVSERRSRPFEQLKELESSSRYGKWGRRFVNERFSVASDLYTVHVRSVFANVDRSEEILIGRDRKRMRIIYRQRVRPQPVEADML